MVSGGRVVAYGGVSHHGYMGYLEGGGPVDYIWDFCAAGRGENNQWPVVPGHYKRGRAPALGCFRIKNVT